MDVKILRQKVGDNPTAIYIPSKDAVLNKERREMLKMLVDTFLSHECAIPIQLNNPHLSAEICKALSSIDEDNISDDGDEDKQCEYLSRVFDLVWQARCDVNVWKRLDKVYRQFSASRRQHAMNVQLKL